MFGDHDAATIGHECMHCLGLEHSFFGDSFLYKAQKTDNIMDYSHLTIDTVTKLSSPFLDRVSTWYWQWDVLNSKIID